MQQRAYGNAKLTTVYVATGPIPKGTSGSTIVAQGLVKQAQIPTQFRPVDALADLAGIRNETTVASLATGDVLASGLFASPATSASASTVASAIPKGDVAITVSVDPVHGVAGLIEPGDVVDVLVAMAGSEQFLYQNVTVLAVGSSLSAVGRASTVGVSSSSTTVPPSGNTGLITFAVPPDAAQRIALAESGGGGVTGSLYLTLVPPGSSPSTVAPVDDQNLIPATVSPS